MLQIFVTVQFLLTFLNHGLANFTMIKFCLWIFDSVLLREIRIKINEKDYFDFLKTSTDMM